VFSPDGTRLVTASDDRTARIWDAATGRLLVTLKGHAGPVNGATFSPRGAHLATVSADNMARLWDVATGKSLATLEGHTGAVNSAVFSADGTRLVTASNDWTVRLWDVATGKSLATLEGHAGPVNSVVFSADGTRLVTASRDGTARLWRVPPPTQVLVDEAKRMVPRCLTQSQLEQFYLPSEPPRWCITGADLEAEDPARWKPKWPYHTTAWRAWLVARDRGNNVDLPKE
jgi:hypothetical protein